MNIIIIQARLKSTRLPEKTLLDLCGKTIVWHVVERCKQSNADKVVLACPISEVNIFKNIVDCDVFGGSELDVLDRYYQCAKKYKAENIIRITSDNAVIDPQIINGVITQYKKNHSYYMTNVPLGRERIADGQDVTMLSMECLAVLHKYAKNEDREHVVTHAHKNKDYIIDIKEYDNDTSYLRLTVDNKEDYELMKKLYEHLYKYNPYFGLKEIVDLYNNFPELFKINSKHSRDSSYYKQRKQNV